MPALLKRQPVAADTYLANEIGSAVRHEYVNGEVFAMVGETLRHNIITSNILVALRRHTKGSPCRVFMEGVKVNVQRDNAYYYPDVVVACSKQVQALEAGEYVVADPLLIVEVLSPSTEGIDRREKTLSYRKISSLKEYLVVPQDGRSDLILHRRVTEIQWEEIAYSPGEGVELTSLACPLAFSDIYDEVPVD